MCFSKGILIGMLSVVILCVTSTQARPFEGKELAGKGRSQAVVERQNLGSGIKSLLRDLFPPCGPGTRHQRFVVSRKYRGEVCDNRTGLWWERSPSTEYFVWGLAWGTPNAVDHCNTLDLNGKKWRLPTVDELITLLDFSVFTQAEALNEPNGLFVGLLPNFYWSATSYIGPADAWYVNFATGFVFSNSKEFKVHAWCVHGAQNTLFKK